MGHLDIFAVNSNLINKIPSGSPNQINVMIEIPKGSNIKYEIDKDSGILFVDRKLFTAMFYPCNYGFIPSTLEGDGDPVDVLVIGEFAVFPLSIIRAIPVGVLLTEDEEGQDSKIIAIPISKIDSSFSSINDVDDIPETLKKQIEHFFAHYKELEGGKYVRITGWGNREMAEKRITEAIQRYSKN
ncbi:MAG TPA: inorganic diphosphatase [Nitrososphaeraceae archaeon]|nr:inorganic diphosphatase [Nitrososphaeraceae archaeon]